MYTSLEGPKTHFIDASDSSRTYGNVVKLSGHVRQGYTFRAPRLSIEGSPVLVGQIYNRYAVFDGNEAKAQNDSAVSF